MDTWRIPLSSLSQQPVFLQPSGSSLVCSLCAPTTSSRRHSLASAFRNRSYFGRPDERPHGLARRQRCSMDGLGFGRPPSSLTEQSTQRASGGADHCSFAVWDRLLREWPVGNTAACFAIATIFKLYPIALALLLTALYPSKLSWRLALWLVGLVLVTSLLQHPR